MSSTRIFPEIVDPPFEFGDEQIPSTGSYQTRELVEEKFTTTMQVAADMLTRLVGENGNGGYLAALSNVIENYIRPTLNSVDVDIPSVAIDRADRPAPDLSGLETDFPLFTATMNELLDIPTIDTSQLKSVEMPDAIKASIDWVEIAAERDLLDPLIEKLKGLLQAGVTGLSEQVEQGIYDREKARLMLEEDKIEQEIEERFANSGFPYPPLALSSALQEQANSRAMRLLDTNQKIAWDQAELAQKNLQFVLTAIKDLEAIRLDYNSKQNDRNLDYAKAVAANAISIFAEGVRAYLSAAEAHKLHIEVQVENLKAIIAYNEGIIKRFGAEATAYNTIIEAKAKKNEAITDIYEAEIKGFEAETKADSANQSAIVQEYTLRLQKAELQLKKAIEEMTAELKGYEIESSLAERCAEAVANIGMQALASAYGAVNMSAGVDHRTSISRAENFRHGEDRSINYSIGQRTAEQHTFTDV